MTYLVGFMVGAIILALAWLHRKPARLVTGSDGPRIAPGSALDLAAVRQLNEAKRLRRDAERIGW